MPVLPRVHVVSSAHLDVNELVPRFTIPLILCVYSADTLAISNAALTLYNSNFSAAVAEFQAFIPVINDMQFRLNRVKTNTL